MVPIICDVTGPMLNPSSIIIPHHPSSLIVFHPQPIHHVFFSSCFSICWFLFILLFPIESMYGIFTYIYHISPLKTTKCR